MADAGHSTQLGNAFSSKKLIEPKVVKLSYANAFGDILAPEFLEASEFRKAGFFPEARAGAKGYLAVGVSAAGTGAGRVSGSGRGEQMGSE